MKSLPRNPLESRTGRHVRGASIAIFLLLAWLLPVARSAPETFPGRTAAGGPDGGPLDVPPLEDIETRDGKTIRGRVVGFDVSTKSYIVRSSEGEVSVPEDRILTIRPVADQASSGETGELFSPSVRESPGPKTPLAGEFTAVESSAGALELVLSRLDALPEPASPTARRHYRTGIRQVRDGGVARARQSFLASLDAAPREVAPRILLGAVCLVEGNAALAHRTLRVAVARFPDSALAMDLLSRASRALGYHEESLRWREKSARQRLEGAARAYELFTIRRRFGGASGELSQAWSEYIALDPDLAAVPSREGKLFHEGERLIEAGDLDGALDRLAQAIEANPLVFDTVRPHRLRALELRSLASRERGDFELFFADLDAIERLDPDRAELLRQRRLLGGAEMVQTRLDPAGSVDEALRILEELAVWVPDVYTAHRGVVRDRFDRLARHAIFRGHVGETIEAFEVLRRQEDAADLSDSLLVELKSQVRMDLEGGRRDRAAAWVDGLATVAPGIAREWRKELGLEGPDARPSPVAVGEREPPGPNGTAEPGDIPAPGADPGALTVAAGSIDGPASPTSATGRVTGESGLDPGGSPGVPVLPLESGGDPDEGDSRVDPGAPDRSHGEGGAAVPPRSEREIDAGVPYFPLLPGSTWVYRHGDGTLDHQELDRVEMHPLHGRVYRFKNHFKIGDLEIPYTKSCFTDGNHILLGASTDPAQAERILRLPIVEGASWSWRNGDIVHEMEYESTAAQVRCRAGEFQNCLKVRSVSRFASVTARPVVRWSYYAPGVGLVKVEAENPADGHELESYSLPVPREAQNSRGSGPVTGKVTHGEAVTSGEPEAARDGLGDLPESRPEVEPADGVEPGSAPDHE